MDILGYIASLVILIGFIFNKAVHIRIFSIIGSILFTIYAIMLNNNPIMILNCAIIIINLYQIKKIIKS
jgi:hypothetical protein